MFGTYIGNNKMLVNLAYSGMLTISSNDLSLMPSLVVTGSIETPLTNYFINNIKQGYTVVDIGANVGYFTILAAKLVGHQGLVIGFEANPAVFELLQNNISMNWLNDQTILKNKAIYSKNTNIEFHTFEQFLGDSSIHLLEEKQSLSNYKKINVKAGTLDKELSGIDKIDLLKIDIEGGEYQAFLGMRELLENKKINRIVFEWNKKMLREDSNLFISFLKEIMFKNNGLLYILNQDGTTAPVLLDSLEMVDFYPFTLIEFMN